MGHSRRSRSRCGTLWCQWSWLSGPRWRSSSRSNRDNTVMALSPLWTPRGSGSPQGSGRCYSTTELSPNNTIVRTHLDCFAIDNPLVRLDLDNLGSVDFNLKSHCDSKFLFHSNTIYWDNVIPFIRKSGNKLGLHESTSLVFSVLLRTEKGIQ